MKSPPKPWRSRCPLPLPHPILYRPAAGPLADRVRAFEKQTILAELKRNHHQISNTARALGWSDRIFIRRPSRWELI
jgi:DNA-binding NtrC family response regulator